MSFSSHVPLVVMMHASYFSDRKVGGRPAVNSQVRALVKQMAQAKPLWGAHRIHGELLKLGIDISERSISRLMPRKENPPSQTWRTFLENHFSEIVSINFMTVPSATFRVLYVLIILVHDRRRVVHFNITTNLTAAWTPQQIIEAFPEDTALRFLLRDRDQIYGEEFRRRVKGDRHRRSDYRPAKSLAKPIRGKTDRFDST